MKHNYDHSSDVYKSNKVEDKIEVLDYGLETINVLINQLLRFNRIVYSTENSTVYNFPKNELPKFYLKDIFCFLEIFRKFRDEKRNFDNISKIILPGPPGSPASKEQNSGIWVWTRKRCPAEKYSFLFNFFSILPEKWAELIHKTLPLN